MKILMLNPPYLPRFSREQRSPAVTKSGTFYYPMWLAYATGVLETEGFEVSLIDAPAQGKTHEEIFQLVRSLKPHITVVDTSTPSIYNDIEVAAGIKEACGSFIVLVGPHVSATPEESLQINPAIDVIARGEYDETLRELAHAWEQKRDLGEIKGISFRRGDKIFHNDDRPYIKDLDRLPFVSGVYQRQLNIRDYFYAISKYPLVTIITGRGCPHSCSYCVYPQVFQGRGYRYRSADNVVEEFKFIQQELPWVKEVFIEDDTFTANAKRCQEIAQKLIDNKISLSWTANSRADVDLETLGLMKAAGLRLLCVGVESGDQKILDQIQKNIKLEQIRQFFKDAKKAKVLVHGCFMVGNPGESKQTLETTLHFAKQLAPDTAQFFPLMVYPGTRAYQWAQQNGYLATTDYSKWLTDEGMHFCVLSRPGLSNKELVDFCDRARRSFYLRPRYIFSKIVQIINHPAEFKRVFKSLRIFIRHIFANVTASYREGSVESTP